METITGEAVCRLNADLACKIRPPSNYLRTWKQGRNLEKLNEIEEDDAIIDSDLNVELSNQVLSNYVIMKNVLSCLCWQDLKLCSMVNKLCRDIATNIQIDKHVAQDFFIIDTHIRGVLASDWDTAQTEPLLVLTFFNRASHNENFTCERFNNSMCSLPNPNRHRHKILDYINMTFCYPGSSMMAIYCLNTVFLSSYEVIEQSQENVDNRIQERLIEPQNVLYRTSKLRDRSMEDGFAFVGGLLIPKITDLAVFKFKVSSSTIRNTSQTAKAYDRIAKVMETNIVKCVFVFVTGIWATKGGRFIDKYVQKIRELQQQEPFALGGCAVNTVVEDNYHRHIGKSRFEVNFVVLAMPKSSTNPENFNAYSVLMENANNRCSSFNSKLEQFSSCITKRRHTAGVKLSCTDRRDLHHMENAYWKKFFPKTCLVGCYGLGEIGADCFPGDDSPEVKRLKTEEDDSVIYSYSTVLVYLTWGDRVD